ncbi:MAG: hypothetical protein PVJ57_06235 [Phycisphaerae bacterium]
MGKPPVARGAHSLNDTTYWWTSHQWHPVGLRRVREFDREGVAGVGEGVVNVDHDARIVRVDRVQVSMVVLSR